MPSAERAWGHVGSPGPAPCRWGRKGSQVRKFTNCGGKGRVLFLVLLLWVFLDVLKCWALTSKIHNIRRILEQKKLTVFPLIKSRAHQRCFQVWTLAGLVQWA